MKMITPTIEIIHSVVELFRKIFTMERMMSPISAIIRYVPILVKSVLVKYP